MCVRVCVCEKKESVCVCVFWLFLKKTWGLSVCPGKDHKRRRNVYLYTPAHTHTHTHHTHTHTHTDKQTHKHTSTHTLSISFSFYLSLAHTNSTATLALIRASVGVFWLRSHWQHMVPFLIPSPEANPLAVNHRYHQHHHPSVPPPHPRPP